MVQSRHLQLRDRANPYRTRARPLCGVKKRADGSPVPSPSPTAMVAAGASVGWSVGSRAPGRSCQVMRLVGDPSGFGLVSSLVNVMAGAGRVMDGRQAIDVPVFFRERPRRTLRPRPIRCAEPPQVVVTCM